MVSRNQTGRHDLDARAAEREDASPWSEDQATTCYMPEDLLPVPGAVYGLPPLPPRFQEARAAQDDQDSREIAHAAAPDADGGGEWLELQTSWDASPPRASGMARRMPRMAASHPSSGMDYTLEPEPEGAGWEEPEPSIGPADLDAYAQQARPCAPAPQRRPARKPRAEARRSTPTRSGAYAPAATPVWQPQPYAHEDARGYPDAPAAHDPWQNEPADHQAYARQASPRALKPTAASTQRQRPQRFPAAPARHAAATGQHAVTAASLVAPAASMTPLPRRAAHEMRPPARVPSASRTVRARPVPPSYAFDDVSGDPFAPPRGARRGRLFVPLLACAAAGALYFGGQLPRLMGFLQPEPAPVLRSTAPAEPSAPLAAPPPPAAEPALAADSSTALAALTPASPPRRWTSTRTRKNQALVDDDAPSPRRRTTPRAELDSEPDSLDRPTSSHEPAVSKAEANASTQRALATLRINSRPWAQIFVDGRQVGNTPQLALQVNAGHHTIRLVNPELDVGKTFELDAHPGQTLSRVELLSE